MEEEKLIEEAREFICRNEHREISLPKLVAMFTNEVSKALLEEAAEKIKKEAWDHDQMYMCAVEDHIKIVRSLIPKEKTTTKL